MNSGQSCYINAIMQVLKRMPNFSTLLDTLCQKLYTAQSVKNKPEDTTVTLVFELNRLIRQMQRFDQLILKGMKVESIKAKDFIAALQKGNPQIDVKEQQDVNEILKLLIDAVDNVTHCSQHTQPGRLIVSTSFPTSISNKEGTFSFNFCLKGSESEVQKLKNMSIKEQFCGSVIRTTTCSSCLTTVTQKEDLLEIVLSLDSGNRRKIVTLDQLLQNTTTPEDVDGRRCDVCKKDVLARRFVTYDTMPPVLQIQLSRFAVDVISGLTTKLMDQVDIPDQLDCFCRECLGIQATKHCYRLVAMIIHVGLTLDRGHYVSYIKSNEPPEQATWSIYNDDKRAKVSKQDIGNLMGGKSKDTPYLIFFQKEHHQSTLQCVASTKS